MNYSNEISHIIFDSLFLLGIFLLPVGIGFCLVPEKMFKLAKKMNRWVVTDLFFNKLNKPRYKEMFFYRHHRAVGAFIVIASLVSFYILYFYTGYESVTSVLVKLAGSELEKWLFVTLYYLLLGAIVLTAIFGVIMFIRPSTLKTFEKWSNQWIDTDGPLELMNKQKNLPDKILAGNPRIFGFFVILGAIYIVWNTYPT